MNITASGYVFLAVLGALLLLVVVLAARTFLSRGSKKQHSPPPNTGGKPSPMEPWTYASSTTMVIKTPEVQMPSSTAKYKQRAQIVSALSTAGLDQPTVDSILDAYDTANPSAFTDTSTLSDAEFRKKTVEFTRRHLRRFPKTKSALALSLRALAKGETTSYIK